ncbi:hypothetical protein E5675_11260 [Sphingopyxis sp. PAMC25046]|uniref:hypothetical protein n=1 Tax=Sphingopyxis sp. PAMC25046 TaxID=2565556 RepID=UPI00109E13FB|nr:hypothetical protein [Sphingopyxis sp. PAMC25046]QCB54958.1 hypothetical protein E5675_11260 [Sphingopyxis sp. PAMC25046]
MFARLLMVASIMFGLGTPCWAKAIPELTAEQWREDVDALVAGLEKNHRDPWNFVSRAEVLRLADEAKRTAKAENQVMLIALHRIAAAIGDGHTFIAVSNIYARYPIEVRFIEGDFLVTRSTSANAARLGDRLVAIDGVAVDKAVEKLMALVPRNENRWHERHVVAGLLTQAEPLHAMGIVRRMAGATFTLEAPDDRRVHLRLEPYAPSAQPAFVTIGRDGQPTVDAGARGLKLSMLGDVAYLDFASYHALKEDSPGVWAAIDKAQARALVIDFRKNGGGSLPAGRQNIVYPAWKRSQLNRGGCLFVLTGPMTFSAAMTNVTDMRRETEATVVGLPAGAKPNGYQENGWFTLPNSGLRVSAAQRRYRFGAVGETAVMPDLQVEQTIEDWRNGRDTALNAALSKAQGCERLNGAAG